MTWADRFFSCAAVAILTLSVAAPAAAQIPFEVVDRSGGSETR